jgi:hypothetical protein
MLLVPTIVAIWKEAFESSNSDTNLFNGYLGKIGAFR